MKLSRNDGVETIRYGIGEWFGRPVKTLGSTDIKQLSKKAVSKSSGELCSYRQSSSPGAICNKKGGVCSLIPYRASADGRVTIGHPDELVTMCPSRFWEGNTLFKAIGHDLLQCKTPTVVKEVGFLASVDGDSNRDVGRIDTVLVGERGRALDWCAIEMQAVYFSGDSMGREFAALQKGAERMTFPLGKRRPDFRSSGPKRLMPQLQIKVPTLRRWGKKMAVVVDAPFFKSLGKVSREKHVSNADIVWFVVGYAGASNTLEIVERIYTTLESSVDALTAGQAVTKDEFEKEIVDCLQSARASKSGKVIQVS
jgi:Restriction endonuclease NotI